MRYAHDHKEKTRLLIIEKAAELFKKEGYKGCGVDAVMHAAGLTPGGFYAHFPNKDALFAEVIKSANPHSMTQFLEETAPTRESIQDMLDWYLSTDHRDNPALGCPIPTLASEVPRQPAEVRKAFTDTFRTNLKKLATRFDGKTQQQREAKAMTTVASMVGAMLFARALDDNSLSNQMLNAMRDKLRQTNASPAADDDQKKHQGTKSTKTRKRKKTADIRR